MIFCKFSESIACAGSEDVFDLVLKEKVVKPAAAIGMKIEWLSLSKEELLSIEGFIQPSLVVQLSIRLESNEVFH